MAISTPPQTRRELVLEAIGRGIHVVADKPFAPTAAAAEELVQAADAAGVLLSVFHNRRWDTDITTLRGVLDGGLLGDIWRFDSRFDLDQPQTLEAGPEGGLLRDLGSHLVDQALWLLGPARGCRRTWTGWSFPKAAPTPASSSPFACRRGALARLGEQGQPSRIPRTAGVRLSGQLRVIADRCASTGHLRRGASASTTYAAGVTRCRSAGARCRPPTEPGVVPSAQGRYADYYTRFAAAVAGVGPQPVPAAEAVATLAVLDAARLSAAEGVTVV